MRAFIVKPGTEVRCIKDGRGVECEWHINGNWKQHTTKKESMFFIEEMRLDPMGINRLACKPGDVTIGGQYAKAGYYGFARDGWVMVVHASKVEVA